MKILVTGGSGFIGSNLVRLLVEEKGASVINLDKLTYAGNSESLADLEGNPNYTFEQMDLALPAAVVKKLESVKVKMVKNRFQISCKGTNPTPSCTSPPRVTSIARSTAPVSSFRPISSARLTYFRQA